MGTKAVYMRCLNPACGGYRVSDTTRRVNKKTGKSAWNPLVSSCLATVLIFAVSFGVGYIITVVLLGIPSTSTNYETSSNIATGVFLIGSAVAFLWLLGRYTNLPMLHHYTCALCGFQWTWREDEPKPTEPTYHPTGVAQAGAQLNDQIATAMAYEEQRRREQERRR